MNAAPTNLAIPYPGLRPFEEADHLLFFGRNEQANQLLMRLEDSTFVAVVGSSGSGKSSLVRAGLLPLIRDGFLFGTEDWKIAVVRPGHEPYQQLAHKLAEFRNDVPSDDVLATLRRSDDGLLDAVHQLCGNPETHVLIDQFEELYGFRRAGGGTRSQQNWASRDDASAFVAMLLSATKKAGQQLRVMITMRSDFVGDCEVFLGLPQAVSQSQFLVPRLTRSQMEQAITGPSQLRQAGYSPFDFEPGLVNTLINEAGDRPDQLPLLQHALMRTWKESDRKRMTEADYNKVGRIEKALSNDADDAWKDLSEADRIVAQKMFLLLCDVSPQGQITRRCPRVREVNDVVAVDRPDDERDARIKRVIREFQIKDRNFLLPPNAESLKPSSILDISHESLLRQWGRFQQWLNDERESAAQYLQLTVDSRRHAEGRAELLSKRDLETTSQWFQNAQPTAAWGERYVAGQFEKVSEFLCASREAESKRLREEQAKQAEEERLKEQIRQAEAQRLQEQAAASEARVQSTRRLLKWVSATAIVAACAMIVAMFYQSQARYAQENALKEAKNAKIKELEANESKMEAIKQKSIAEKTLYTAYTAQVRFADDAWERGDVIKARQYLDDAQWNLRGWEHDYLAQKFEVTTFRGHSVNVSSVSFSPDGKRIVSGSYDKTLKVWDAATVQETLNHKRH